MHSLYLQNSLNNRRSGEDLFNCTFISKSLHIHCKFYCTENIQNVHNYRYNIPQSCPGVTKHRCSALEKLRSLFFSILILITFFAQLVPLNVCLHDFIIYLFILVFFLNPNLYFTTFTIYRS